MKTIKEILNRFYIKKVKRMGCSYIEPKLDTKYHLQQEKKERLNNK